MLEDPGGNSSIRLWSFQSAAIMPTLVAGRVHRADWSFAPANFRLGYEWMSESLASILPGSCRSAPVWCWHSCNGEIGAPPTVGTAMSLLGFEAVNENLVALELSVPSDCVLLSSYYAWNRFLDVISLKERLPRSQLRRRWLFESPLLRHSTDDIQAVIPEIQPSWVLRASKLVLEGRDEDAPALCAQ